MMMELTKYLSPERIRQGVLCSSKKRALEIVGDIIAEQFGIKEKCCTEHLFNREKMGCTGIGGGIALPHTKLPEGDTPMAVFLQLETPIDYQSNDKREVDLIYALFIPEQECVGCRDLLSNLAKKLTNKALSKQLRVAQSVDEIWEIFQYFDRIGENNQEMAFS